MKALLLASFFILTGCSGAWKLNKEPIILQDKSEITVIHAKSTNLFGLGGTLTGLYVFQFKGGECSLVRADSSGSIVGAIESLKTPVKILFP